MTKDELAAYLDTFIQLGDVLRIFIQGEWDDRIVAYLKAFRASDELLELLAGDLTRILPAMADDKPMAMTASDGSTQELNPAAIFVFVQLAMAILRILKQNRN